jgi:geranyl-CoA carboxylase alpha subunit
MRSDAGEADGKLRALMNGKVIAVMVGVGDEVQPGQPLVTIEAMKIEHVHTAAMAGRILAIHARTGEQVRARALLAEVS